MKLSGPQRWVLDRLAEASEPRTFFGSALRTANALARRGLVTWKRDPGAPYSAYPKWSITDAGRAALSGEEGK